MFGLAARNFIPANTCIIEYCGEILTNNEVDTRSKLNNHDPIKTAYVFEMNSDLEIIKKTPTENGTFKLDIICG